MRAPSSPCAECGSAFDPAVYLTCPTCAAAVDLNDTFGPSAAVRHEDQTGLASAFRGPKVGLTRDSAASDRRNAVEGTEPPRDGSSLDASASATQSNWLPSIDVFKPLFWAVPCTAIVGAVEWEWTSIGRALTAGLFGSGAMLAAGAMHLRFLAQRRHEEDRSGLGGFVLVEIGTAILGAGAICGLVLASAWRAGALSMPFDLWSGEFLELLIAGLFSALTLGSLRRRSEAGRLLCGLTALVGLLTVIRAFDWARSLDSLISPLRPLLGWELDTYVLVLQSATIGFCACVTMFGVRGFLAASEPLESRQPSVVAAVWWLVAAHAIPALALLFFFMIFFMEAGDTGGDAVHGIWLIAGLLTHLWVLYDAWQRMPKRGETW
jgi:hypothetical protein